MNEEIVEVQEDTGELLSQEITTETATVPEIDLSPIIGHLEHIQRVQADFYNDVTDILLFSVACIIGLFAFKEFMDRATRW